MAWMSSHINAIWWCSAPDLSIGWTPSSLGPVRKISQPPPASTCGHPRTSRKNARARSGSAAYTSVCTAVIIGVTLRRRGRRLTVLNPAVAIGRLRGIDEPCCCACSARTSSATAVRSIAVVAAAVRADDRHAVLPGLNADIIDKGIATGDTGYIWRVGVVMLGVTLVQVVFAIGAVYYGSRTAMGFGRDVRSDLFHQVTAFSAQEVGEFGAPSLITRITNDVQQVQMLVLMSCTLLVAAPITAVGGIVMAIREDAGLSCSCWSASRSWSSASASSCRGWCRSSG